VNATEFDEIIAASWTRKDKARARIRARLGVACHYVSAHENGIITTTALVCCAASVTYIWAVS